ncbi:DUF2599 domain-containing protein [Pseudomonas abietaniphila]|uniref:DUF2599 domain-containing protein n=1 Tax=Pseudomonas abietaniphila TaxID=89065 RepID=UPI0007839718|nr:DUF2599 domain-containing protein [Pseudomonas abietaniphila]
MKRMSVAVGLAIAIVGCTAGYWRDAGAAQGLQTDGAATADRLNRRLDDVRSRCEHPADAVYQCSGVLLKGVVKARDRVSWSVEAANKYSRSPGFTVSYLRADARMAWTPEKVDHGFILYPARQTPQGRMEAAIKSLSTSVQKGGLRVDNWSKGSVKALPIEAFFFIGGRLSGLRGAQYDQREFYKLTGIVVPVIALVLNGPGSTAPRFVYDARQQGEWGSCPRYIKSAVWSDYISPTTKQRSGSQLKITPTDCGRLFPEWEADLAFAELAREYGQGPRWKWNPAIDSGAMRRQYVCLRLNYNEQATWTLETFRFYVEGVRAKEAACNP